MLLVMLASNEWRRRSEPGWPAMGRRWAGDEARCDDPHEQGRSGPCGLTGEGPTPRLCFGEV